MTGTDPGPLGYELNDHTQRHRVASLDWTRQHNRWVIQGLNRVVFTEKSNFNLNWANGKVRVWRRRGERLGPANGVECDGYGGGSVMIMGGISHEGKTELKIIRGRLTATRYCADIILSAVYLTYTTVIQDNHVVIMLLSLVEYICDHLGRRLR